MKKNLIFVVGLLFSLCNPLFSQEQEIVETKYFSSNKELGGEVTLLKSFHRVDGTKTMTSFEIEAPRSGRYYISFWLCPPRLNDGTYASYDVSVNDKVISGRIIPTRGDWQSISLSDGEMIELNEGINTVSVIGTIPDIPSVEHIRVSSTRSNSIIDSSKYDNYKADIIRESTANAERNALTAQTFATDTLSNDNDIFTESVSLRYEDPRYDYTHRINMSFSYTFYKIVHFTQGQQVSVSSTGINNFGRVLELFSKNSPENYSWAAVSCSNSAASLNVTIPQGGYYYVRVRSYSNARSGLCNLNINNQNYYDNIPVYSIGVTCTQDTSMVYNTFTCHSTSDPRLWVEEYTGLTTGIISAFNDDYHGNGDFDWDQNSRIKKQYSRPVHAALLSAYGSYNPDGKCDLYIKCKNSIINDFPLLKTDDAILSSPGSFDYNCIAWSGGITSYGMWPPDSLSYYTGPNPLTAFDFFYESRGFTRDGATEENSVIDLWALVDSLGNREYTHASIRNGADRNVHGYDWESKAGDNARIFHPRYSLAGENYGEVVEHYIKATQNAMTLEEEIANCTSRIEYIDFDENEREIISRKINTINHETQSCFQRLYDRWKDVTKKTIYSNPKQIANCDEYRKILEYCKSNNELLYAIYEKLGNGDGVAATKLIGDLTFDQNSSVIRKIRDEILRNLDKDGVRTIRPLQSNYMAYVKELLSMEKTKARKAKSNVNETTGISYSNFADFDVSLSSNGLTVEFLLTKSTNVSLNLMDLAGNVVCYAVNNKVLESGSHSYSIRADKNHTYLVRLMLNGRVNVKKIMVK